jgi:ABC-type Fe3+-hydroxamate transport system substrate-binding protein
MHENRQKILCLVPSWTETLVECGLNVVGRTRFCIHPAEKIKNIAAVGGTKNFNLSEILKINPDVVIMDKEENRKEMAGDLAKHGIRLEVSHVTDLKSAVEFLHLLSRVFKSEALQKLSAEYRTVSEKPMPLAKFRTQAVIEGTELQPDNVSYVIWKNPYMVVNKNTFIADVLSRFGFTLRSCGDEQERYPVVSEEELKNSFCLFSSEPYRFASEFKKLTEQGYKGALVDGEKISWYGIRNFRFLQDCAE